MKDTRGQFLLFYALIYIIMASQEDILRGVEVDRDAILKRFVSGQLEARVGEQGSFCPRYFRQDSLNG